MKLYYKAGACSLAPHIILAELNMVYEIEAVDLATKMTASGANFRQVNPKGAVPTLKMDNGEILTEGAVIDQYLADQKPEMGLLPKFGTLERYRCLEWLNYVGTEIHKGFGPLFFSERLLNNSGAQAQNELKDSTREALGTKFSFISEKLGTNDYLLGKQFTIADAYLFTVITWSKHVGIDMDKWSNLSNYLKRVSERPAVQRALKEEGLLK